MTEEEPKTEQGDKAVCLRCGVGLVFNDGWRADSACTTGIDHLVLPAAEVDEMRFTFAEQANQHPKVGTPGIGYTRNTVPLAKFQHRWSGRSVTVPTETPIDVLLHRNSRGKVTGILYYYPEGADPFEEVGAVNVFIAPNRQRRGIGTALVREALRRWPEIDLSKQSYTEGGKALAERIIREAGTVT